MKNYNRLAHSYFFAKKYIINKGFGAEIDWQDEVKFEELTEQKLLEEFTWVVIASGLNDKIVRKIFPIIKTLLFSFKSARIISLNAEFCYNECLKTFNHPGKIKAILFMAEYIYTHSFPTVKQNLDMQGVSFIRTFPYMGNATSYHLAKNIGINVAKPDRHLVRISNILGFENVDVLCAKIGDLMDEKVSLVDLVLWRYATLDKNYISKLYWLNNRD